MSLVIGLTAPMPITGKLRYNNFVQMSIPGFDPHTYFRLARPVGHIVEAVCAATATSLSFLKYPFP